MHTIVSKTLIVAVIGSDRHAAGARIPGHALEAAGYNVVPLSAFSPPADFVNAAVKPMPTVSWFTLCTDTENLSAADFARSALKRVSERSWPISSVFRTTAQMTGAQWKSDF